MALVSYPSGLPIPLQEGYQNRHVSPMQRTEFSSGRSRNRRRFTSVPTMVPISLLMSQGQAQAFEVWFAASSEYGGINDGTDWFYTKLRTPMGIKPYEVRFTDMYEGPDLVAGRYWRFSAELEIRERQILPREWALTPELVMGSSIIDKAINREWPKE